MPVVKFEEMDSKKFYKDYLSNNLPVLVDGGSENWPAIENWKDKSYLKE